MIENKKKADNWGMIGHEQVVDFFKMVLKNDQLSHAYIFYGSNNIGKETFALKLAEKLFCENSSLQCDVKAYPDLTLIGRKIDEKTGKQKKLISIDQIRGLCNRLGMSSLIGGAKVAIINEAEWLSIEAANALLKTLEAPSKTTVIILLTENISRLPETIRSRSQVIRFNPVNKEKINAELLKKGLDEIQSKEITGISFGRPGKAINFCENPEAEAEYDAIVDSFVELVSSPLYGRLKKIEVFIPKSGELIDKVKKLEAQFEVWEQLLRDVISMKSNLESISHVKYTDEIKTIADKYSFKKISLILKTINQVRRAMHQNANPQLVLEKLFIVL